MNDADKIEILEESIAILEEAFDIACSRLEELDRIASSMPCAISPVPFNKTKWKRLIFSIAKVRVNHDNT